MKLIGIEEHFLAAEVQNAWYAIGLDALDPSVAFPSQERVLANLRRKAQHLGLELQPIASPIEGSATT